MIAVAGSAGACGQDVAVARGAPDDHDPQVAWVISVWVAPEARGQGFGAAVIEAVATWAAASGRTVLKLGVGDFNEVAIALYERLGFQPNGEVDTLPSPRQHVTEHIRVRVLRPRGP